MAFTFVSILTLAGVVAAAPLPQIEPTSASTSAVDCKLWYQSQAGDTCQTIGLSSGYYDTDILAANTFLDCNDIWTGTWVCIPNIPYPTTVTYATMPVATPTTTTSATSPTPMCIQTYTSVSGDTCDSVGSKFGITGSDIYNSNTFLNCNDIWSNTPICVPGIFHPPISTTTAASSCTTTYYSAAGDTCDSIGAKYGVSGGLIGSANSFITCNDIWVGTPVCIPAGPIVVPVPTCMNNYISQAGDTCDSIGAKYQISGAQILAANSFLNCNDIWAYTPICVPWPIISDPYPTDTVTSDPPTDTVTFDPTNPVTTDLPTYTEPSTAEPTTYTE